MSGHHELVARARRVLRRAEDGTLKDFPREEVPLACGVLDMHAELDLTVHNFTNLAVRRDRLRAAVYAADALAAAVDTGCDFGDLPASGEAWLNNVRRALDVYRMRKKGGTD